MRDDAVGGALQDHFLSDAYASGRDFDAADSGYERRVLGSSTIVYVHPASGMQVWSEAVELTEPGADGVQVLFHYTSPAVFREITGRSWWRSQLWALLRQGSTSGGVAEEGVYASVREPACHGTRGSPTEAVGGSSASRAPAGGVSAPPLAPESRRDCCVPILVARGMAAPTGAEVGGPPGGGELRLLQAFDDGAAARAARLREARRKAVLRHREAALGPDAPDTLRAATGLAIALQTLGRSKDCERLLRRVMKAREARPGAGGGVAEREALGDLAWALQAQGRLPEAEGLCRRMLRGWPAFGDEATWLAAEALTAQVLLHSRQLPEAEAMCRRVAEGQRALQGAGHWDTLASKCRLADVLARQGRADAAATALRSAEAEWRRFFGDGCPHSLAAASRLAALEGDEEASQRSLVGSLEAAFGGMHEEVQTARARLAELLLQSGSAEEAAALYAQASSALDAELGPAHPVATECAAGLAAALEVVGRLPAAEAAASRVEQALAASLGSRHPDTIAAAGVVASLFRKQNKLGEAIIAQRDIVAASADARGDGHPSTVEHKCVLAAALQGAGRRGEAERLYRQIIASGDIPQASMLDVKSKLGALLKEAGDLEEAESVQRSVVAGRAAELGEGHADTMASVLSLAEVLELRGKDDEAESLLGQELCWREGTVGVDAEETIASIRRLAKFYQERKRLKAMEELYRHALDLYEARFGSDTDHPGALTVMSDFAKLLELQEKLDEAESLHRHVLSRREKRLGREHPDTLVAADNLGCVLQLFSDWDAAEQLHEWALQGLEAKLGAEHPATLASMSNLAALLAARGKLSAAEAMLRQVLQVREVKLGPAHPDVLSSVAALADVLVARGKDEKAEALIRREAAWAELSRGRLDRHAPAAQQRPTMLREVPAQR